MKDLDYGREWQQHNFKIFSELLKTKQNKQGIYPKEYLQHKWVTELDDVLIID